MAIKLKGRLAEVNYRNTCNLLPSKRVVYAVSHCMVAVDCPDGLIVGRVNYHG